MKTETKTPPKNNLVSSIKNILVELRKATGGHVIAYQQLVSKENANKIDRIYSTVAEEEWLKVLQRDPKDWVALHHLAILYHARAFELEIEGKNKEAIIYWNNAHRYWYDLFELGEPIDRFHKKLKQLERYNQKDLDVKIHNLKENIKYDLVDIHRKLYEIHNNQTEIADYHIKILINSPFKESSYILKRMYENKYGNIVSNLSSEIDKRISKYEEKHFRKYLDNINNNFDEIINLYSKYESFIFALRDIIILISLKCRIRLQEWVKEIRSILDKYWKLVNKFEEVKIKFDEIEAQINAGSTSLINERNSLATSYNKRLNEFKRIDKARDQHIKKLNNICDLISEGADKLQKMTSYNDYNSIKVSAESLGKAITDVIYLETEIVGMDNLKEFKDIRERCREDRSIIESLLVSSNDLLEEKNNIELTKIWNWTEFKSEENPYYNTSFLLFDMELPLLNESTNLQKLINKMKLYKQKTLDKKSKSRKHFVLGKQVTLQKLNEAVRKVDSPVDFCKDMLLQHQAHHSDTSNVKNFLEEIELPAQDKSQIKLSSKIFSLFSYPAQSEIQNRKWDKSINEKPIQDIRPKINWPK